MNTGSFAFPNMFDVARNKVGVFSDAQSIVSRVRLMLLTEPTELYMNLEYGVGLKKYMFQYNSENIPAMIQDDLIEQIRLWEPCVVPESVQVQRGLLYSGQDDEVSPNQLNLTISLESIYGEQLSINLTDADFRSFTA